MAQFKNLLIERINHEIAFVFQFFNKHIIEIFIMILRETQHG